MLSKTTLFCTAFALAGVTAPQAFAQASGNGATTIEEVVVTARKREESLQNIPVAVSAISGENLARAGIREPSDLSRNVPSLQISGSSPGAPTGAVVSLRGQVASDVLLSLSQPVGFYEDSVNIPHPVGSNVAFFDLQRVEVLKGPQGTLYGRNTTGGAINVITRGADYAGVHGFAYGEYGNHKDWKVAAAVNVPLVPDMLAARVAYQHWDRQGFGHSAITGEHFGSDRDDDLARLSVKIDPMSTLTGTVKVEYLHARRTDAMYQTRALGGALGPLTDAEWAFEGAVGGVPPSQLIANTHDLFTNYTDVNTFDRLSGWHFVSDWSWDVSDYVRLRSITGYHQFKDFRTFDLDALPLFGNHIGVASNGVHLPSGTAVLPLPGGGLASIPVNLSDTRPLKPDETSHQWTQEFNLSGNAFENHFSWLVGAFYATDKGRGNQTAVAFPILLAVANPPPTDFNFDEMLNTVESWALFTQNDIKFNDVFSITFGARYTEERLGQRISDYSYIVSNPAPAARFICTAGPNNIALPGRVPQLTEQGCAQDESAKFSGTSYLLSFNFQFTPNTLFYVKTARGFRGGALQVRAPDLPAASPEIATDYEVGLKTDLFDKRLRANLAVYQTNYDNKQETLVVTDPATHVSLTPILNAASARIRGVEGEFTAAPIENLTLGATFTYLDSQYISFPHAFDPLNRPIDATGAAFATPKWTYDISGRYVVRGVGPGDLALNADWAWRSKIPTTLLNFNAEIPANVVKDWRQGVGLLNASLEYTLPDRGLTITAFSTNLLNKHYQVQGVAELPFGYQGVTQEPRMYGVSIRKTFGKE